MINFLKGTVTPVDWIVVAVVIVLTAGLCAGFYFVVYAGQQQKLDGINAEVDTLQKELNLAYETRRNIEELRKEYADLDKLVKQFRRRLPAERDIPRLLYQFEGLGDNIGLSVKLTSLPTITEENRETIPYEVTAFGNFHQIVTFINLLERDNRYFKISDIDIGEEVAGVAEAKFTLSTFRLIEETSSKADEQVAAAK
jgi:Tfp pilus assembly protein PilO